MTTLTLANLPGGSVMQRAIWWSLQIDKWLLESNYIADIPDGATVVILPSDDPELCNHNLTLSRNIEGPQVIIRLDRIDDSSRVMPSMYTPLVSNHSNYNRSLS